MANQLLATKSVDDLHADDTSGPKLRRVLSATALTALGIGGIIGTGIFVLTGVAAAENAGPALALAFIVAGIGCTLAGQCYAEFAAMIPVSGSAYSYSYATLGEGIAWFIGWNLVLEYLFAVATVSVGWSGYLVSLLDQIGMHLPTAFTSAPFAKGPGDLDIVRTGAIINVPAMAIIAALTVICYIGIHQSSGFNTVIVAIKVTVVLLFIAFGIGYINSANWHPFIPDNVAPGKYGWSGLLKASGVIFFAYIGFDAISTAAQETKNPQRDMPIGILSSLVICTILYVVVALVLTGMVNYKELNVAAPVALAIDKHPALSWMGWPVKLGALAGMAAGGGGGAGARARGGRAGARGGRGGGAGAGGHPRGHTPSFSTVLTGVCAALNGGLFPVDILGKMVSIGTLAAFVTVCIGVLVLRYSRPDLPRPFRTPWPWFTCIGGALVCGAMMLSLGWATWARLVVWTAIGAAVYIFYGYRHSRLHGTNGTSRPARASSQ